MDFWKALQSDVRRFKEEGDDLRILIRGLVSQGFAAIFVYRVFHWCYERGIPTMPFRFVVERLIEMTTGISIPAQVRIGNGIRIHHFGGIVIHSNVSIGDHCTIYQGVTLGDLGETGGVPQIGHRVLIGAGAKIIGDIQVGDDCRIGANAVVTKSVPPGYIAVGVPAVMKMSRSKDS